MSRRRRRTNGEAPVRLVYGPVGGGVLADTDLEFYADESGNTSANHLLAEVDKAVCLRDAVLRKVKARRSAVRGEPRPRNSLRAAFDWWVELRARRGKAAWKDDESRLRLHVLPALGDRDLDTIRPSDLEEVFLDMRVTPLRTTGTPPAPKTVWNTYAALKALFRDARKKELTKNAPCILSAEELGPIEDANPEWRAGAIYERDECTALMFDDRIEETRRIVYATLYLTGIRIGEFCGLRVSDFDRSRVPLAKLTIARQYSGRRTKTRVLKEMPVHPVLMDALLRWLDETWPALFGRPPEPTDLIFPRLPDDPPSRHGNVRDKNYERRRRDADLERLGLRNRRGHDLRASFITHALDDGADRAVLERLTHPSSAKASAFDGYRRIEWGEACRAVGALRVEVPADAVVAVASGGDTDPGSGRGGPTTPPGSIGPTTPVGRGGVQLANHDSNHDSKRKAQGLPGLSQWRRRESKTLEVRLVERGRARMSTGSLESSICRRAVWGRLRRLSVAWWLRSLDAASKHS